ncbi:hypothetical protein Rsub_13261 [Raphidocelis subcapitata]|uniref:Uncharacterized protein n=1 Tax=Raphidocelis subcapitata TaxID=307507 RepID=A0A2V0PQM1_9CHLO|nr:hypothetical protein Rsub_13261 [Raphidocelis subcapitata]|eukprot:GBG00371.1 hypothetical protein Rsub_13261 [Raphidocelis subcapitata]
MYIQYFASPKTALMSFNYMCTDASTRSFTTFRTGANDWGGGSTVFLDRHNVDCGANRVLNEWKLVRPSANQIAIQYVCGFVPTRTTNCELRATAWSSNGRGQVNFLDRHSVYCPGDKMINRWQVQNDKNSNIRFLFNCCDA